MEKQIVKGDGNCLFYCVSLALFDTIDQHLKLREIVASVILSNPDVFSKVVLATEPEAYA